MKLTLLETSFSVISSLLPEESISIFALSTFNTDYILIKEHQVEQARTVLTDNDYFFVK